MTDIEFGFTRAREDATALEPYLNPLPRSVTGSEVFILLDGAWRFALDVEDRGLQERWYLGHTYSGTTEWPGSIELRWRPVMTHSPGRKRCGPIRLWPGMSVISRCRRTGRQKRK